MTIAQVHDRNAIERHLRRRVYLHLYELGDLDDFFWPRTTWYALEAGGGIRELALIYCGPAITVLLAFAENPPDMRVLLQELIPLLPDRFYAHLLPGGVEAFDADYRIDSHGPFAKLALTRPECLATVDASGVVRLGASDRAELEELYSKSYPGNWFDPRMLETGCYYGIRIEEKLASAAGVHVYSPEYKVAAIGNVATRPERRGRGLATRVCAKLCGELMTSVHHVGLNVGLDNRAAIACYRRLGFEQVYVYEECTLIRK